MTDLLTLKIALLADWQQLCHDDFDEEEDMNEDEYWEFLQELSPESLRLMEKDDFDEERTPAFVLEIYGSYISPKYNQMLDNEKAREEIA